MSFWIEWCVVGSIWKMKISMTYVDGWTNEVENLNIWSASTLTPSCLRNPWHKPQVWHSPTDLPADALTKRGLSFNPISLLGRSVRPPLSQKHGSSYPNAGAFFNLRCRHLLEELDFIDDPIRFSTSEQLMLHHHISENNINHRSGTPNLPEMRSGVRVDWLVDWLLVGHWFLFFFVYLVRRFNVLSSRSQTFQWYSHLQRSLWTVWCSDWAVADWAVEWTKHLVLLMMTIATQAKKETCWKMRSKSSRLIPSCTSVPGAGARAGEDFWANWDGSKHCETTYSLCIFFFVGHAMDFSIFPARSLICYVVVTRIKTLAFFSPRFGKMIQIDKDWLHIWY